MSVGYVRSVIALHFINQVLTTITRRADDPERGASMVEYALLVALIGLVVLVALGPLGDAISGMFTDAADAVSTAG